MKNITLTLIFIALTKFSFGQCNSLFSFGAYFEQVSFYNQSTTPNAHYYWNFGDGTSSNLENPIHTYPENGTYLATQFVLDTVSGCSDYYEFWLSVTKNSSDSCQPSMTDSVFNSSGNYYITAINYSTNCSAYSGNSDVGVGLNFPIGSSSFLDSGWGSALFTNRIQYVTNDTISGYVVHREAYKTLYYKYLSSHNYGPCSANFEFSVMSKDTNGTRILFKAMNKSASFYEWEIVGFGSPIYSNYDTISKLYGYGINDLHLIKLITNDASGCKDTITQRILIRPTTHTVVTVDQIENESSYKIYPNPFVDQCVIELSKPVQNCTLRLYNTSGQVVLQQNNIYSQRIGFNRNNIPHGLYYFVVTSNGQAITSGKVVAN
jgi:hypothetical protein